MSKAALCDQIACDPLYLIDVSHIYHFSHSQIDDDIEAEMSKERLSKGDFTPAGEKKMYTGAPYYRGFANNSNSNARSGIANDIPATVPFLKPSVTIFLDKKSAINDIVKCMPRNWPVLNEKSLENVLDKIKNYTVDFDGIQLAGGSTSTGDTINTRVHVHL